MKLGYDFNPLAEIERILLDISVAVSYRIRFRDFEVDVKGGHVFEVCVEFGKLLGQVWIQSLANVKALLINDCFKFLASVQERESLIVDLLIGLKDSWIPPLVITRDLAVVGIAFFGMDNLWASEKETTQNLKA